MSASACSILVRLLRDGGVNAPWLDKYCENLLVRGSQAGIAACGVLAALEAFDLLVDPLAESSAMLAQVPIVLLFTELISGAATPRRKGWYLGRERRPAHQVLRRRATKLEGRQDSVPAMRAMTARSCFRARADSCVMAPAVAPTEDVAAGTAAALRSKINSDFEVLPGQTR